MATIKQEGIPSTEKELEKVTPPAPEVTPPPPPAAELVAETPVEEMVSVPKATLDALMTRVETVESDLRIRSQVDDKNTANKIEELRKQGKLLKSVKLRKFNGQYVLAYKTLKDEVYFKEGRLYEDQQVKIFLRDETSVETTLRHWATTAEYVPAEVLKESRDQDGNLLFTVKTKEGDEFEINVNYVN